MAKDLTGNITTELATAEHRPIELYTIYLDNLTLHFTDHDSNVSFYDIDAGAQTFVAVALSRGDVKTHIDNKIDSVVVRLDNINRTMSTYISGYEFRGRRMVIMRVYEDYLSSATDFITIFDGLMDSPVIGETSMQLTVKSRLGTLDKFVPRRIYQLHCNYEFGDTYCGVNKHSAGVSGVTVDDNSTTSIVYISGSTYEGKGDGYYKYGTIEFTSGSNSGEKRMVTFSSGANAYLGYDGVRLGLDIAVDTTPIITDTVTLQPGCDKTFTRCSGTFTNYDNYGGFLNIHQLAVVR